jgi:hypothetical protein
VNVRIAAALAKRFMMFSIVGRSIRYDLQDPNCFSDTTPIVRQTVEFLCEARPEEPI